jgi:hypothetical protein
MQAQPKRCAVMTVLVVGQGGGGVTRYCGTAGRATSNANRRVCACHPQGLRAGDDNDLPGFGAEDVSGYGRLQAGSGLGASVEGLFGAGDGSNSTLTFEDLCKRHIVRRCLAIAVAATATATAVCESGGGGGGHCFGLGRGVQQQETHLG